MSNGATRGAGFAGLVAVVLLFGGQALIQSGGTSEPAFTASTAEIVRYFDGRDVTLFRFGSYAELVGLLAFLWFVCGLYVTLRADDRGWLPAVALGSGIAMVGGMLFGGWELATLRLAGGLDPQLARLAFDMGNLGLANAWVALGSFALAAGWAIRSTGTAPGWLSWWGIVAGAGLVAVRVAWTSPAWFFPYAAFWLWVVVVSVRFSPADGSEGVLATVADSRRQHGWCQMHA